MSAAMVGELAALLEKVTELLALRALGDRDPPSDRLRALAARFPGALRELDRSSLERLEAQRDALALALEGGAVPAWAVALSRYHGWLRVGLRLRAAHARSESAARAWAASYGPTLPGDPTSERVERHVCSLAAPPAGRLVAVAAALAAEDGGMTIRALEAWLDGR